jgi:hypothetical protein
LLHRKQNITLGAVAELLVRKVKKGEGILAGFRPCESADGFED